MLIQMGDVAKYHLYTDREARVTYNATLARFMLLRNSREKYVVKVRRLSFLYDSLLE